MNNQNIRRGNPQEVVYKNCHSKFNLESHRFLLSKVRSRIKYGMTSLFNNNQEAEDPRQNSSGMTSCVTTTHGFTARSVTPTLRAATYAGYSGHHGFTPRRHPELDSGSCRFAKAFTLIELLVVVLIIGILAAVALPQYQLAVVKSRVATYLPLMKAINDAETAYYLANGEPSLNISKLDIDIPASCVPLATNGQRMVACGNDFLFDNSSYEVVLSYCPGHNTFYSDCKNTRDFSIAFYNNNYKKNGKECIVTNNSSLGTKICKSFAL